MVETKIIARPWQPQDLIDDLQELIDEESDNYLNTRRTTLCMAKSFLEEHFAEPKWIPVTERLPEEDGRYLCNVKSFAFKGAFYITMLKYDKGGFIEGRIYTDDVTHWMPLPEPPEGE